jgi:hypothetical protein
VDALVERVKPGTEPRPRSILEPMYGAGAVKKERSWPGRFVATQMRARLTTTSVTDPVVHSTTAVTLLAADALASLVPTLRASSVDR